MKPGKPKWGLQSLRDLPSQWRGVAHRERLHTDLPCPWRAALARGASAVPPSSPGVPALGCSAWLPGRALLRLVWFQLPKLRLLLQVCADRRGREGIHRFLPWEPVNCGTRGGWWARTPCIFMPWSACILSWQAWFIWRFLFFFQPGASFWLNGKKSLILFPISLFACCFFTQSK